MPELDIIWPRSSDTQDSTQNSIGQKAVLGQWWDQVIAGYKNPDAGRLENLRTTTLAIMNSIPDPQNWGSSPSPFNGLVVGAVQSGKTESMIGVSALAIDAGYRMVIVLTGNNEDLRRQTALRFNQGLLRQSDRKIDHPPGLMMMTIDERSGPGPLGGYAPAYHLDATVNRGLTTGIRKALDLSKPVVLTVKKDTTNLESLGAAIRATVDLARDSLPILILYDECDEGSVGSAGPRNAIPRSITNLWKSSLDKLKICYLGYTATAAANLMQDPENPLYPSDFIYLLRYPYAYDSTLSWKQNNFKEWYSGGELFYRQFGYEATRDRNFIIRPSITDPESRSPEESESLYDALIAYFVSGSYRLLLDPEKGFDHPENSPDPHSMLVQASQSTREHLRWRDAIKDRLGGTVDKDRITRFDPDSIYVLVAEDEQRWIKWFEDFHYSTERIRNDHGTFEGLVANITWDDVKAGLKRVVENTCLKVVNSDSEGGSSLDFEKGWSEKGSEPPQDCYVIVVGGQKLSRGITIEGLCISYYTRESLDRRPFADVTLQLSRWFGYRGKHIQFCRLFVTPKTHSTLLTMHENDQDYRKRLADLSPSYNSLADLRIALRESPYYRVTAKLAPSSQRYPLKFSPFTHLFKQLEIGSHQARNESWAAELVNHVMGQPCEPIYDRAGNKIGIVIRDWSASDVADILDGPAWTGHNPDNKLYPNPEYFRSPDQGTPVNRKFDLQDDPYVVAAYLRYWDKQDRYTSPKFNIVIPFGQENLDGHPFTHPLLNEAVNAEGVLFTDSWRSDFYSARLFNYMDDPGEKHVDPSGNRISDCPGLLALYVIHKNFQGHGTGIIRQHHTPAVGICIPSGGPSLQVVANYEINA